MQAIDIIDECVSINYNVQKNSRKMKTTPKKFVGKYPILYTPQALLDDEVIATGSAKHSIIKPGTPQSHGKKGTCIDHLSSGLIKTLNSRPNTPGSPSKASTIPILPMGPVSDASYNKLPRLRKSSSFSFASFSSHSIDMDSTNASVNTNETDLEARRIIKAVENELKHWWKKYPHNHHDSDERGYCVEELTETYVVRRLDTFPVSSSTLSIRKEIMTLLENFEVKGILPYRVSGDIKHQYKEDVKPITNYAKKKVQLDAEKIQREEQKQIALEEEKKKALIEKKKKEKELRKRQYDSYMQGLKS